MLTTAVSESSPGAGLPKDDTRSGGGVPFGEESDESTDSVDDEVEEMKARLFFFEPKFIELLKERDGGEARATRIRE